MCGPAPTKHSHVLAGSLGKKSLNTSRFFSEVVAAAQSAVRLQCRHLQWITQVQIAAHALYTVQQMSVTIHQALRGAE